MRRRKIYLSTSHSRIIEFSLRCDKKNVTSRRVNKCEWNISSKMTFVDVEGAFLRRRSLAEWKDFLINVLAEISRLSMADQHFSRHFLKPLIDQISIWISLLPLSINIWIIINLRKCEGKTWKLEKIHSSENWIYFMVSCLYLPYWSLWHITQRTDSM